MNSNLEILGKKWEKVAMSSYFSSKVPGSPGIYLVVKNNTYLGIPVDTSVYYVGRALKSLKSRFLSHNSFIRSHNRELLKLIKTRDKVEFWFQKLSVKEDEIINLERELIRSLRNYYLLTNKIVYN